MKSGELTALEFSLSPGLRRKLNTRPVHLHLFNDCLLLSRPRESVAGTGGQSTSGEWDEAGGQDSQGQRRLVFLEEPSSVARPVECRSWPREEKERGSHRILSRDHMAGLVLCSGRRAKWSELAYHILKSNLFGLDSALA